MDMHSCCVYIAKAIEYFAMYIYLHIMHFYTFENICIADIVLDENGELDFREFAAGLVSILNTVSEDEVLMKLCRCCI